MGLFIADPTGQPADVNRQVQEQFADQRLA
jgi:hypothetical protein